MSVTEIRAGDVVECILASGGEGALTKRGRYLVSEISLNGCFLDGAQERIGWSRERFRLLLRKGDVVRVAATIKELEDFGAEPSLAGVLAEIDNPQADLILVHLAGVRSASKSWVQPQHLRVIERDGKSLMPDGPEIINLGPAEAPPFTATTDDLRKLRKLIEGRERFTTHDEALRQWQRTAVHPSAPPQGPIAGVGLVPPELRPERDSLREMARALIPEIKRAVKRGVAGPVAEPVLRPGWDHVRGMAPCGFVCGHRVTGDIAYVRGDVLVYDSHGRWHGYSRTKGARSANEHATPEEAMEWAERELLS